MLMPRMSPYERVQGPFHLEDCFGPASPCLCAARVAGHTCTIQEHAPAQPERRDSWNNCSRHRPHNSPTVPPCLTRHACCCQQRTSDRTHAVCRSRATNPHTPAASSSRRRSGEQCGCSPDAAPQPTESELLCWQPVPPHHNDHHTAAAPVTPCLLSHTTTQHTRHMQLLTAAGLPPLVSSCPTQRVIIYSSDLSFFLRPSLSSTGSRYSCRWRTEREECVDRQGKAMEAADNTGDRGVETEPG